MCLLQIKRSFDVMFTVIYAVFVLFHSNSLGEGTTSTNGCGHTPLYERNSFVIVVYY